MDFFILPLINKLKINIENFCKFPPPGLITMHKVV